MNCPLCGLELDQPTKSIYNCPQEVLETISHYQMSIYKTGVKHALYMDSINLTWWEDEEDVKVRLIGDFNILSREKANTLEEVVHIGNRFLKLMVFL